MILSRSPPAKLSADTSPSSSAPRPHLGTSCLLKFKRHQDSHCSFRRTWGKFHTTKKNLIVCAAAAESTVNMSLKADAEPNNNVSIEEEVSWEKFDLVPASDFHPILLMSPCSLSSHTLHFFVRFVFQLCCLFFFLILAFRP